MKNAKNYKAAILETCPTLGEIKLLYATKEAPNQRPKITCSQEIYDFIKPVFGAEVERVEFFYIILLNRGNKVLGWHLVSQGGVSGTVADPKVIFQAAILANASAIILCHNHPSGSTQPSAADIALTEKVKQGGLLLDIATLDHVIVTAETYCSMADEGYM